MSYAPTERFEIARVLSRMAAVISRNLPVFAGLALTLSGLPALLVGLVRHGPLSSFETGWFGPLDFRWLFGLLISALLQAALIHGTISDLNGRRVVLGDCLATAIRNVLPLIGISIASSIATIFGLVLFIVPGVILALSLCVAAPVQVVEGHGVFSAMGRSGDLTRGHRGSILLLFILFGVLTIVLQGGLGLIDRMIDLAAPTLADTLERFLIAPLSECVLALIGAAGVASIYFELRTIKEGIGVEALAAAFD
jgi:hypothetical protein